MAVSLTPMAAKQVKQLMAAQKLETRSSAWACKGGGCSGMSYDLEFDNELRTARQGVRDRRGQGGRAT